MERNGGEKHGLELAQHSTQNMISVRGQEKVKALQEGHQIPSPVTINWAKRRWVFILFVTMNLLLNYDTGVIPASLIQIKQEVKMSFQEQAALGSLVYIGICSASLIVSTIFQQFSATRVLTLMMVLNSAFCLMFSFSYNLYVMYFTRLGMGFTQAFCVIYAPVWTNEFSPSDKATRWMGILQAAVPLGVMAGYATAGTIVNTVEGTFAWRYAIQIQAILELPVIMGLYFTNPHDIDIVDTSILNRTTTIVAPGDKPEADTKAVRIDTIPLAHLASFWEQIRMLISNWLFIWITLALCSLYYVVTGIQYWITIYLIEILHANPIDVLILFSFTCISAPLVGVMVGSHLSDYMGGYKGGNLIVAIKLCVVFALLACIFSMPIGYVGSLLYVAPPLWLLLFFGGALIPTATGINVNTVSR